MRKHKKPFDAVQTMRDIRDRLSEQFEHLSFAEQKRYMRERLRAKSHRSPKIQNLAQKLSKFVFIHVATLTQHLGFDY